MLGILKRKEEYSVKQNSVLLKNIFQIPVVIQDNRSQRMLPLVEEKMKILIIPVSFSTTNILKLFCDS